MRLFLGVAEVLAECNQGQASQLDLRRAHTEPAEAVQRRERARRRPAGTALMD